MPGLASEDHTFPTPTVNATEVKAAFAPNGYGAVAWVETLPEAHGRVDVSVRPPGGTWSAAQPLGATTRSVGDVHVAIDASGDAAVAWEETMSPSTFVADVATRPANGAFGTPETFNNGAWPRVGIDAAGNVTLLYAIVNSGAQNGEFVRTAPAGESMIAASPHTLSTTCWAFEADLAVAPSGDAIAGFGCSDASFALRTGGTWGKTSTPFTSSLEPCPPNSQTFYSGVRVAIDDQGHPAGVVRRTDRTCIEFIGNSETNTILLALPTGGEMSAGPEVAKSGTSFGFGFPPNEVNGETVGIGGGSLVVAWLAAETFGFKFQPQARIYPGNGASTPGPVQPLGDPSESASGDQVSIDPAGDTLLTWSAAPVGGKFVPFADFRPAGGAFGAALAVSDATTEASSPSSAIDDTGDGIVGWLQVQGSAHVTHARGFDATPPQLSGTSIPATAQVGTPAAFSAQAFDVWGPVSFAWSFGDGAATDASPSHTFSAAGQHTITVTATDSAGNEVSQSAGMTVTAPPSKGTAGSAIPSVSGVRQSATVWREGNQLARFSRAKHKPPVGTTFSFTLNMTATARFDFTQRASGRKVAGKCVAQTKRNRRKAKCTRTLTLGTLSFAAHAGANTVRFQGRLSRTRKLKPGHYTLLITATSSSGGRSAPQSLSFTIVTTSRNVTLASAG
jgi:PKD domain-containing protein